MQVRRKRQLAGFTIIELMLAMGFISVLLLAIVMTAIQAGRIYNKGLVVQSVNQAGRDVADQLRRDFLQTDARRIAPGDDGSVIVVAEGGQESGRLCLGQYSYLWNIPNESGVDSANSATVVDSAGEPITFVRVADESGALCVASDTGQYERTLPGDEARITHLLRQQTDTTDVGLAIHSLRVMPAVREEGERRSESLYRLTYTIGTSAVSEISSADQTCKAPNDEAANDEFCAINQFEMLVRTNG